MLKKIPLILKAAALLIVLYGLLKLVKPPLPASIVKVYLSLASAAIFFYVTVRTENIEEFKRPILSLILDKKKQPVLTSVLILLPTLVGFQGYSALVTTLEPPGEIREIHPSLPSQFVGLENPLREDKDNYEAHLSRGRQVFYRNCFFCHGDLLDGQGHFASGFSPNPADFTDSGTIVMLTEGYVFWRVSKGGPGLPPQSTPWNSAMPIWENFLTEEERWSVIMFLYDQTGYSPRTFD